MSVTVAPRPDLRTRPRSPSDRAWRRVRTAAAVDAFGSGLFVPVELLFLDWWWGSAWPPPGV